MKWQRARILLTVRSHFAGEEVWVRLGPPIVKKNTMTTPDGHGGAPGLPQPLYESNRLTAEGHPVYIRSRAAELLARGPEDFADDVALVPWPGAKTTDA